MLKPSRWFAYRARELARAVETAAVAAMVFFQTETETNLRKDVDEE